MIKRQASVILFFSIVLLTQADQQNDTYTAAVIEVKPHTFLISSEFAFYLNIEQYALLTNYLMKNTNKKLDLIVFPEMGLQGDNDPFPIEIPNPEDHVVACSNDNYQMGLKTLSCIALESHIYVVINLAESYFNSTANKTRIYSTTIVFDRGGELIAKYRKYNLLPKGMDRPNKVDYSFFLTDFGVTFGILTGDDLLFKEPAVTLAKSYKIKHFVHPSKWVSELPFLTAIQTQAAWSYAMNSVLISAGYNDPEKGNGGSGIYKGQQGPLDYSLSEKSESFALVAEIPKDTYMAPFHINLMGNKTATSIKKYGLDAVVNQPSIRTEMSLEKIEERLRNIHEDVHKKVKPPIDSLKLLRDDIEKFKTYLIKPTILDPEANISSNATKLEGVAVVNKTVCQDGFCCTFLVMMTTSYERADLYSKSKVRGDSFPNYGYRLAAFNGLRKFGSGANTKKAAFQICGIIPCLNDSVSSCAMRTDDIDESSFTVKSAPSSNFVHNGFTYVKRGTSFNSIVIKAEIIGNDTTVFPNILLGPNNGEDFGSLLSPKSFSIIKKEVIEKNDLRKQLVKFSVHDEVSNLATASIYARVYHLDNGKSSASHLVKTTMILFITVNLLVSKSL